MADDDDVEKRKATGELDALHRQMAQTPKKARLSDDGSGAEGDSAARAAPQLGAARVHSMVDDEEGDRDGEPGRDDDEEGEEEEEEAEEAEGRKEEGTDDDDDGEGYRAAASSAVPVPGPPLSDNAKKQQAKAQRAAAKKIANLATSTSAARAFLHGAPPGHPLLRFLYRLLNESPHASAPASAATLHGLLPAESAEHRRLVDVLVPYSRSNRGPLDNFFGPRPEGGIVAEEFMSLPVLQHLMRHKDTFGGMSMAELLTDDSRVKRQAWIRALRDTVPPGSNLRRDALLEALPRRRDDLEHEVAHLARGGRGAGGGYDS